LYVIRIVHYIIRKNSVTENAVAKNEIQQTCLNEYYESISVIVGSTDWKHRHVEVRLCSSYNCCFIEISWNYYARHLYVNFSEVHRNCNTRNQPLACHTMTVAVLLCMHLKFGERSFSCAGSRAWNSLPSSLHELTDTDTFKRRLKTFLFNKPTNSRLR